MNHMNVALFRITAWVSEIKHNMTTHLEQRDADKNQTILQLHLWLVSQTALRHHH